MSLALSMVNWAFNVADATEPPFTFRILELDGQYAVERRGYRDVDKEVECSVRVLGISWRRKTTVPRREPTDWRRWFVWTPKENHPREFDLEDERGFATFDSYDDAENAIRYFYGHRAQILPGEWRQV